jgi:hypothetical protein
VAFVEIKILVTFALPKKWEVLFNIKNTKTIFRLSAI